MQIGDRVTMLDPKMPGWHHGDMQGTLYEFLSDQVVRVSWDCGTTGRVWVSELQQADKDRA